MFKYLPLNLKKEYRPELNGLRALAVILVLLFHLDFNWMQGGFLGVDVFLVISGYFISKNILYSLQKDTFAFSKFYTKRLRRLFPALIVTLIFTLIAGYFLLTPIAYERLGKSAFFSSFSLSNFFFWSEAGYFNSSSSTKPLLHMWSLSLEEQFYLFWPLLLVIFNRFFKKFQFYLVAFIIVASLLLGEFYFETHPEATFFLIPFRMFEFLLGASCIWLERGFINKSKITLEIIFSIGFFAIVCSAIVFSNQTRMPGFLSLIPCGGAMLIILAGKAPTTSWSLRNKIVEGIGKSSYSIYLIHWPLIVYYKYYTLLELTFLEQVFLGVISIALGFLMWHYVENTFRYRRKKTLKIDPVWITVPVVIGIISVASIAIWNNEGFAYRFNDQLYMSKEEILANRELYFEEYRKKGPLIEGKPNSGHVIVMGNSHSIDLIYALRQNGFEAKITALNTLGKCYNFGESADKIAKKDCDKQKEKNLSDKNWDQVDAIYLHDNWSNWDAKGLKEILSRIRILSDAPIYVFGPKMTYNRHVPEIVKTITSNNPSVINKNADKFSRRFFKTNLNKKLTEEFKNTNYREKDIYFIDMFTIQGGKDLNQFEVVSKNNLKFLYFDNSHFTPQGSKEFGAKLKKKHPLLFNVKDLKESYK